MQVLVTGAAGFVGRALIPVLAGQGHEVIVTDRDCAGLDALGAVRAVAGDIAEPHVRAEALAGAEAVIHLATVPGGAAEEDPARAWAINMEATMALTAELSHGRAVAPFVFASSIAVFGDMPAAVDDETPIAPRMIYGAHKAMLETWLATLARRGQLSALSLRLPGIVARPPAPSGMKSAFISNVFHALVAGQPIKLPVSAEATMWLMSVRQAAVCLAHGLDAARQALPPTRAVTLPATRVRMGDLVAEIARQSGTDAALARYERDSAIEAGFGRQPPLTTPAARRLGFTHDGGLEPLVRLALATL